MFYKLISFVKSSAICFHNLLRNYNYEIRYKIKSTIQIYKIKSTKIIISIYISFLQLYLQNRNFNTKYTYDSLCTLH